VKTDRRDALKLERNCRAEELTAVWLPDAEHEALRDLVRTREAAKKDQLRAPSAARAFDPKPHFPSLRFSHSARLWILTQTL